MEGEVVAVGWCCSLLLLLPLLWVLLLVLSWVLLLLLLWLLWMVVVVLVV